MEKLVFVLRRSDAEATESWCESLRTTVAARLVDLGVAGVTVYVRDAAVQAALMRMVTLDPPIAAAVTVWVEQSYGPEATAAADILAEFATAAHGYLVTESVPLRLDDSVPNRTEGFGNLAFLRRPAELTQAQWLSDWQGRHTAVAIETQSTFGYTQNVVVRAITPDAPAIDAIVEEQFPAAALTDPLVWYGARDAAEFQDRVRRMLDSVTRIGADRDLDTVSASRYPVLQPFSTRVRQRTGA
ncbi:EthD domain-containing protein [Nocardia anaemiae]|uniref:EthD domain-containing protein n=1 Tax=Nocardia anaemiae TaxID=263910 RepID=UPI0007A37376|nr:EthD domain-containing protein [Nocardia anaemiae]